MSHSTGPITAAGKAISSQNALTHGLRSKQLLLPSESAAELAELQAQWHSDYQPDCQVIETLVDQLVFNQWMMFRADRRQQLVESSLPLDPLKWTKDQEKTMDRIHRYRTANERSFNRALSTLEKFRKDRVREAATRERLARQAEALQLRAAKDKLRAENKARTEAARAQRAEAKAMKFAQKLAAKSQPAPSAASATTSARPESTKTAAHQVS